MFGLTLEKIFVISILAAAIIGPQRLPLYTHKAAKLISQFKAFVSTTRERAEAEIGVPLDPQKWEKLDLKQYDPRRIVREALVAPAAPAGTDPKPAGADPSAGLVADPNPDATAVSDQAVADPDTADPVEDPSSATAPEPRRANPSTSGRGARYAVSGSSAHPWRVRIPEPAETAEGPSDDVASDEFVEEPSVR